jgi:hypothetical protein
VEIGEDIFTAQNVAKDIARIHQEGFEVDDDNEPLPENVPTNGNVPPANEGLYEGQSWGWDGVDWQITMGGGNYDGPSFPNRWTPQGKSFLDLFLYFFPIAWFLTVLLAKMDKAVWTPGGSQQPGPCHFW